MTIIPEMDLQDMFDNPDKYDDRKIEVDYGVKVDLPVIGFVSEVLKNNAIELCDPKNLIVDGNSGFIFIFRNLEEAENGYHTLLDLSQNPNYSCYHLVVHEPEKYEDEERPIDDPELARLKYLGMER